MRDESKRTAVSPTGFWQVPPEVWVDEEAMDDFAERVFDHMKAAHEGGEVNGETVES